MNQPFNQLLPYVRAIVGSPQDGVVEFIGSAFLCKDAEGVALITAAHVTDHLTDEYPLFVDRPDEGLVQVYGKINATKSNIKNRELKGSEPFNFNVPKALRGAGSAISPPAYASYDVLVHQLAGLRPASFRPPLADWPLPFASSYRLLTTWCSTVIFLQRTFTS